MENKPEERTLYYFWAAGDTRPHVGWWHRDRWVALYGDGMWSPEYVDAWCEIEEQL